MTYNKPLSSDDCRIFYIGTQPTCYVPITKVASTYLRRALPARSFDLYNWCWYQSSDQPPNQIDMNFLVMLRDPVQRWISGATEFWSRCRPQQNWQDMDFLSSLFDQIEFDVHTLPQSDFLTEINLDKTTWLLMGQEVAAHHWFSDHSIDLRAVEIQERNLGNARPQVYFDTNGERCNDNSAAEISIHSALIQRAIYDYINANSDCREKIKQYYRKDYDLISSVNFY